MKNQQEPQNADKYFLLKLHKNQNKDEKIASRYWLKYNAKSNVASVKTSKFDENVVNIVIESAFFNIDGWK